MASSQSSRLSYVASNLPVQGEVDVTLQIGEGELPASLRGVLYRNGPGKMEVFGAKYQHPFDGDGMVTRFAFGDGQVHYRNRFVRTREYVEEERVKRMRFRSFGTNLPGGMWRNFLRMRFKNAANTSVVWHGGKLLALWEGGLPHWLDETTLETRGRYDYAGKLHNRTGLIGRLLAPELPFSAHPKFDESTRALINFGTLMGPSNKIVSYTVHPDGTMDEPTFTALRSLSFVHDFVLTPHYSVYFLSAVAFGIAATLFGLATPAGSLTGHADAPSTILLVPRDGRAPIYIPAKPGFLFHFANGYEDVHGCVVLDGMRMDGLASGATVQAVLDGREASVPPTHPTRYVVNPVTRTVSEHRLTTSLADLPTIDSRYSGKNYRHFWAISGRPGQTEPFYHRIMHYDHAGQEQVRDFEQDFPGEPLFVPASPDASEGEGWLLSMVYRTEHRRTDLYVLNASDLTTVCRLELPHHVPTGFHGIWVPAATAPPRS